MTNSRLLKCTTALCVMAALGLMFGSPISAMADVASIPAPDRVRFIDDNGVDLVSGKIVFDLPILTIGSDSSGITRDSRSLHFLHADNFYGTLNGTTTVSVNFDGFSERYIKQTNGTFLPDVGAVNAFECSGNICIFTLKDGTRAEFDKTLTANRGYANTGGLLTKITKPDGEVITLHYRYEQEPGLPPNGVTLHIRTLVQVTSSMGWAIKETKAYNSSIDYCDPLTITCSTSTQSTVNSGWGSAYSPTRLLITNDLGETTTVHGVEAGWSPNPNPLPTKLVTPTGVTLNVTWTSNKVSAVNTGTSTWNYAYAVSGALQTVTITNPDTTTKVVVVNTTLKQIVSETDELGRKTSYTYDASGRLQRVINPDATFSGATPTGGYTEYAYDSRSNVTTTTFVPKAGTGLANLVTTAAYPASCIDYKSCNKPTSVTNAAGVTTSYSYDANTGGIATVTTPAVNGVSSQVRYTYATQTPSVKNSSGVLVPSTPVYRLTQVSTCLNGAAPACLGTDDEALTIITYGTNNVQPVSVTRKLGNNTRATTTNYTYDNMGNVTSNDGPLPNDTAYYIYNAANRLVGEIGPDPDGAGPLLRYANRTSYNTDGAISKTERGTVTGTDATALAAISVLDRSETQYDATTGVMLTERYFTGSNSTPANLIQASYDSLLRVSCVAERLNPAAFTSLPVSACTLGSQGADGPDKIIQYTYDAASTLLKQTSALNTGKQADDFVKTLNAGSGTVATVADGKANKTTYTYDGFNRPIKACFPTAANGAVSSTTDCNQIVFTGARPTSTVLRDGQSIAFTYDNAGRVSNRAGAGLNDTLVYNNFGYVKSRTNNSLTGTFSYNALGELLSDAQPMGTVNYEYDGYGRRSKVIYPTVGGVPFNVSYTYGDDGPLTAVLVSYNNQSPVTYVQLSRDSYGRRTNITRGPGSQAISNVGYDASSRINSLYVANSATNNTITLGYSVDGKVKTRQNSNGGFDYVPGGGSTTNYGINGLNQIGTVNTTTLSYDARGNLSTDGSVTYTYNSNNLLTSTTAGAALAYDASNRLRLIDTSATAARQFLYDGTDLIAEFDDNGTLTRRYVHGPGSDVPLVWFDGIDNTQPRYLTADQQGSIIGVTDASGNTLATNKYDGYGLPAAGNLGTFQYTGQQYLPEIGLYYYKARLYSPTLGRFMQPDPIGYGDGMNMYAYVNGDPINRTDSMGLSGDDAPVNPDGSVTVRGKRKSSKGYGGPSPHIVQFSFPKQWNEPSAGGWAPMEGDVVLVNGKYGKGKKAPRKSPRGDPQGMTTEGNDEDYMRDVDLCKKIFPLLTQFDYTAKARCIASAGDRAGDRAAGREPRPLAGVDTRFEDLDDRHGRGRRQPDNKGNNWFPVIPAPGGVPIPVIP